MQKPIGIVIGIAGILALGYVLMQNGQDSSTHEDVSENVRLALPSKQQGLGSLCASEDKCKSFCLTNRGQCESYCRGKGNELCKTLFPPKENIALSAPDNKETCINNPSPVFTHPFVDISKISEIFHYGNNAFINPGAQVRSYVVVKEGESTPVYAPVNVTIKKIYLSDKKYIQSGQEFVRPEYRIDIEVSCEVFMGFDHIISLSDKLKMYAPQTSAPGKNDGIEVSILIQAGEVIGYTSGGFPGHAFDFLLMNRARQELHLNPSRWTTDHSRYMDCQYDYFTPDLKNQYLELIPEVNGMRDCGPIVQEIPNTATGYWFQENATETSESRFVIYGTNHFVEWTLIKENFPLAAYRTSDAEFTVPRLVTEGKSFCYFDKERNMYLFLKMLPNDKLSLVSKAGNYPSSFPEDKAEVWER